MSIDHIVLRFVLVPLAILASQAVYATSTPASRPYTQTVAQLPTGPEWATRNPCLAPKTAAARQEDHRERLPNWHSGASLATALKFVPLATPDSVALCRWGQNGWFLAPAGWHAVSSAEGEDGGAIWSFESATGRQGGWAEMSDIPACVGCMIGEAQGLFPSARAQQESMADAWVPAETLSPVPDTLKRPNRCVVDLTYRSGGLQVEGQVYWDHINMDDGYTEIFIALPPAKAQMRDAMFASFWNDSPTLRNCPDRPAHPMRWHPARTKGAEHHRKFPIHWPTVRHLPVTGDERSGLVRVVARDAQGNALGAVEAWALPSLAGKLPPVTFSIPAALQSRISLEANGAGWSVHPKGWVQDASDDYVPGGISTGAWVDPGGAAKGWQIRVSDYTYQGGRRFAADALIPAVGMVFHRAQGTGTHALRLEPTPASLTHSDECTARITYSAGDLQVQGVAYMWPQSSAVVGHRLMEMFIALPPSDAKLQAFLLRRFAEKYIPKRQACTEAPL